MLDLLDQLGQAVTTLEAVASRLEPDALDADRAARAYALCAQGERLLAGVRLLVSRRVEQAGAWTGSGCRSAAEWLALSAGSSFGRAARDLETAAALERLPATADAVRAGRLSEAQAEEIASAASVDPSAEQALLDAAGHQTLRQLRAACERVRDAARPDERAACEDRAYEQRSVRHMRGRDGIDRLAVSGTALGLARLMAALDARAQVFVDAAREASSRQPYPAYLYDALISLAGNLSAPESRGAGGGHRADRSGRAGAGPDRTG
jgi:hypothetical protein